MVSNFFTDFFTGRPSDDTGSSELDDRSTITNSKSNVIEPLPWHWSPKQPQINLSTSDLPTPNINIISPTESNISDITTELPTSNSPTSDTPTTSNPTQGTGTPFTTTQSPVRSFSSRTFHEWGNLELFLSWKYLS